MNWRRFWNQSAQLRHSDFSRQVGRTFRQVPATGREIDAVAARILGLLDLGGDAVVLDIACGNGLVTSRLADRLGHVTGIDFSEPLIAVARTHFARPNVDYVVCDALDLPPFNHPFDGAVCCAALQFLDRSQTRKLLGDLSQIVRPGGRLVLADVADADRIWSFYRGWSGRVRWALELVRRRPTIGYWRSAADLTTCGTQTRWSVRIEPQPATEPNHYFRYDAVLTRVG